MRLFRRSWTKARQRPNRWSRNSMRFQQDTDTIEVEQLKLLKGKFDPKTLVAGKRGLAVVIRHTVSDRCQTFSLFVDLARRALALPRVAATQPHQSALCYCCHPPPRARPTPSCIAPC